MTADGKIATRTGASKWITGEAARKRVQYSRKIYSGIMVGIGTVLADDPMLTCRLENAQNPVRIICDSSLRIPLDSNIVKTAKEVPTIIACTISKEGKRKIKTGFNYRRKDRKVTAGRMRSDPYRKKQNRSESERTDEAAWRKGIDSILLEGRSSLNYSALQAGIVSKVETYIAPKIFGGELAKTSVGGIGVEEPGQAFFLKIRKSHR